MSESLSQAPNGHQPSVPAEIDSRPLPVPRDAASRSVAAGSRAFPVIAAGGGFLAGMVTLAVVRGLTRRVADLSPGRRRRRRGRRHEVVGSRSFLVDVHVLKR